MSKSRWPEGKLIVIEGIDGSGTSTQASMLRRYLVRQGRRAHCTQEPSSGPFGMLIRLALQGRLCSPHPGGRMVSLDETTMALAFAADRADHLNSEILPRLREGIIVISDRYYLSSLAYQSGSAGYDWVRALNAPFRRPDLTILLDVSPAVCFQRITADGRSLEIYEKPERLEQVRAAYLSAAERLVAAGECINTMDGDRPVAEVHAAIVALVEESISAA